MNISHFVVPAALGLMGLTSISHDAHAAIITWGAATTISGDGDILNTGTKVGAFNIGGGSTPTTTINGVTFDPFAVFSSSTTLGNFTLATSDNRGYDNLFGSTSTPFAGLTTSYKTLLQSGAASATGTPYTLTMGGLAAGTNYSFQWWANDSSGSGYNRVGMTATSGNSVTLDPNTTSANGGVGQFAIGTFTADSTSQVVTFANAGGAYPLINAFQLRSNNVVPTPEPSTYAMMALGLVALCVLGAKRKKDGQAI